MKLRGPAHKPIAAGLLTDPAFSPDPLTHPYHNVAWSISPPLGHPVINPRTFTLTDPDSELRLIQPPNSPVSDIATQDSRPRFLFPPPTPPADSPATSPSPPVTKPQRPTKPKRKFRMPFLTRRKTTQPVPKTGDPAPAHPPHDVTQPPRPAVALRRAVSERTIFTPNPATTGTDTPRSTASSSTRNRDLDRIDELDESSPLGISLHHGGPYEAAVQAIRRSDRRMPLGMLNGTGRANEYHRQAMLAHGNVYIPPQVPTGVSLKLSPGQILPRDFRRDVNERRRAVRPPRSQNSKLQRELPVNFSPNPQIFSSPPSVANYQPLTQAETRSLQPEPLFSRQQSQAQPPVVESRTYGDPSALSSQAWSLASPLPNPHPILSGDTKPKPETDTNITRNQWRPVTSLSPDLSAPSTLTQSHNPAPNPVIDNSSLTIGLAMLESEDDILSPEIYLHPEVAEDVQDFDPYNPIHMKNMKNEHPRTPSPLISAPQDKSRESSPESLPRAADQGNQDSSKAHEKLTVSAEPPVSQAPPPYSSITAKTEIRHQPQPPSNPHQVSGNSQAQSRIQTPEPAPSTKSNGPAQSDESGHSSSGFKGSRENLPSENPFIIQPRNQESPQETQPIPTRRERSPIPSRPLAPSNHDRERDGTSIHQSVSTHSSGQIRHNLQPLPNHDRERDGTSTHHSVSTHSSGRIRHSLQPPPNRYLPKRLVMPAPLDNRGVVSPPQQRVYQPPPPAARFPPQVQVQFRRQSQEYFSQSDPLLLPPILNSRPEPQMTASRKLKKRASTITSPSNPTAPIITTVSFAPPVIGFQPNDKMMMHSKLEKVSKRVLSKRRTDL